MLQLIKNLNLKQGMVGLVVGLGVLCSSTLEAKQGPICEGIEDQIEKLEAQLDNLADQKSALFEKIRKKERAIEDLEHQRDKRSNATAQIDKQIRQLEREIQAIQNEIDALSDKMLDIANLIAYLYSLLDLCDNLVGE